MPPLPSRLLRVFSGKPAVMGEENGPGAIVSTRTACLARSRAMGSVMDATAPLVAE